MTTLILFLVSLVSSIVSVILAAHGKKRAAYLDRAEYTRKDETVRSRQLAKEWRFWTPILSFGLSIIGLLFTLGGLMAANDWLGATSRYFAPYGFWGLIIWTAWILTIYLVPKFLRVFIDDE